MEEGGREEGEERREGGRMEEGGREEGEERREGGRMEEGGREDGGREEGRKDSEVKSTQLE